MKHKAFIVHVAALSVDTDDKIYPSKRAQIAHLEVDEVLIKVSNEYADFANVFLPKQAIKLSEHMEINNYAIELIDN